MNRMARVLIVAAVCAWCLSIGAVTAQDARRLTPEQLKALVITQQPETRVAKVDQERLVVRRLDVVDEAGVIRMVLASPTPQPILDGIQYKRMFPVSGVTFFDAQGSERGGIGVADIEGSAVITAQDHANADAIGWRVMPDGAVSFHINERPALIREKALGDRLIPVSRPRRASRWRLHPTARQPSRLLISRTAQGSS